MAGPGWLDHHADSGLGLLRGVLAMIAIGAVMGGVYNWKGLDRWGISWIAEDKLAEMPSLEDLGAGNGDSGFSSGSDPMAVTVATKGASGLPVIPDIDRPIEVGIDAVKQFHDAGAVVVVDAREAEEFAEGHIAGAINMPYDLVTSEPERLEALATGGKPIVVYCGGGACELSLSLAYDLIYAGHPKVLVYMGGFTEWAEAGNAVSVGPDPDE